MTNLVSTTKNDFEDIISRAQKNIKKIETMPQNAASKMKIQEDKTSRLANIINNDQHQFDTLATRQLKIDEQLSAQNDSLIYLQDRIEHILDYIYGDNNSKRPKSHPTKFPFPHCHTY